MPGLTGLSDAELTVLFAPLLEHRRIGLAVSGGPDSLALMLLVHWWRGGRADGPEVHVYSVDHRLRPEAASEAAMVVREAERLGFAARVLRWDEEKPETGVQAAARAARYRLMGRAMIEDEASLLVTAHHLGDQAETVLMRMAHGSGLSGLRGMAAETLVEGVRLFRPLLGIAPEALRAVVDEAGLAPAQDPSNLDDDYERVRWRAMLPRLAELGLTPGRLGQFAARAGQADAALEHYAAMAMAEGVAIDRLGAVAIDRRWLLALPEAVGVRLLSKVMEFCGGGQRPRALGVVEAVYAALSGLDGGAGRTALGCLVRLKAETIWLVREPGRTALPEVQLAPGAELLWDQRFQIRNRSARRSLSIAPARHMTREGAERLLGHAVEAPSEAIRAAPLVSADDGTVLALGGHSLDAEVESVVQRPPN